MEHSPAATTKKFSNWQLPVILLIALTLRFLFLEWAQANAYGGQADGLEAYEVAVHFENGDDRALYIGQPNCNLHSKLPGPLWTAFCAAGLKLFGSINGIVLLTIFGNVLALALTWRLARDLAGGRAANIGTLLMAISPWAVHYSAIVWNPSLMPLFGVTVLMIFFYCHQKPDSRMVFFIPLLLLAGAQFHMSTLSLIIPLVAAGWLARLQVNWRWLATGIFASVICYTPYVWGEAHTDWANTRGMLSGSGGFSPDALKIFSSPGTFLINRWDPGWTYTPADRLELARMTFGSIGGLLTANLISDVCAVLLLLAAGWMMCLGLKKLRVERRYYFFTSHPLALAVFIFAAYLIFNLVAGKPFHARYCLLVLPLLFLFVGVAADACLTNRSVKTVFLPVLTMTIAVNLWFMPRLCWFEKERIENSPVFVPGWTKLENVYRRMKSQAPGRIEVLDQEYIQHIPPGETNNIYRYAHYIGRYAACRDQELQNAGTVLSGTNYFELRSIESVNTNDPAVAFHGNGIALVAVPEPAQR